MPLPFKADKEEAKESPIEQDDSDPVDDKK
jgi:hypothetical protein